VPHPQDVSNIFPVDAPTPLATVAIADKMEIAYARITGESSLALR
jgi:hypothetical protein